MTISRVFLVTLTLAACGPTFDAKDTTVMQDSVNTAASLQVDCARSGADAGGDAGSACDPATVRAKDRQLLCAAENLLFRHGKPIPDAGPATGIICNPQRP
jgi:hypothetical protein